jgi:hypothetical protein
MSQEKSGVVLSKTGMASLVIITLLLLAGGAAIAVNWKGWFGNGADSAGDMAGRPVADNHAVDWEETWSAEVSFSNAGSEEAVFPGYTSLSLKANQTGQSIDLYNPAVNDCYFVISLLLPDGTAIWKSGLISPGQGLHEITLARTIPAGLYENSTLKYECFKMNDELTPLQGGEVTLVLKAD